MVRTNHYACRNALQTSLIREKIRRRISSTINCEIQKSGAKLRKNLHFKTTSVQKKIVDNSIFTKKNLQIVSLSEFFNDLYYHSPNVLEERKIPSLCV